MIWPWGGVQVLLLVAMKVAGGGASCASRGRADVAAESALGQMLSEPYVGCYGKTIDDTSLTRLTIDVRCLFALEFVYTV